MTPKKCRVATGLQTFRPKRRIYRSPQRWKVLLFMDFSPRETAKVDNLDIVGTYSQSAINKSALDVMVNRVIPALVKLRQEDSRPI